jgi:outer membrane protein OmpA-like peptidoglycan-associated protein
MLKDGLMKKITLFTLTLLLSLPGCKKDKETKPEKKQRTEQRVNVYSDNVDYDSQEDEMLDEDDDLRTLFDHYDYDDSAEAFIPNDEYSQDYMDNDNDEDELPLAWIDTQIDDELKPLYFEFNSYKISDSQKQALDRDIDQVKQLLADAGENTKVTVVTEGHTCREGTPEYNIGLSENRAKAVADLLVNAGIDKDVIKVVGRGQENPLVEGKTRAERAPNRRVEVRVIYA